jgi:hypothetical protein
MINSNPSIIQFEDCRTSCKGKLNIVVAIVVIIVPTLSTLNKSHCLISSQSIAAHKVDKLVQMSCKIAHSNNLYKEVDLLYYC